MCSRAKQAIALVGMEDILAELVGRRTITQDTVANNKALDYIEDYLSERGMFCERFEFDGHGALVATTLPRQKKPTVILAAHVDVMAGSDSVFTLAKKDGKLLGRGTFDMKFAIAAYLHVVDTLRHKLADYDFGIMITTDEELGGVGNINGTERLLAIGYRPNVCFLPDGGDDWKSERIAKGYWRFNLIAAGETAHGSRPWEGDSASFKLTDALYAIKSEFEDHGPTTDTLNIGVIHGGEAMNQVPSLMTATLEIRLSTNESLAKQKKIVHALCKQHGIVVQTLALHPPTIPRIDHPLIAAFQQSIKAVTGTPPDTCISFGGSDAKYFNDASIPCIVTRPPGGGLHGENEWMSVEGFQRLPKVIAHYLQRTAKREPTQKIMHSSASVPATLHLA